MVSRVASVGYTIGRARGVGCGSSSSKGGPAGQPESVTDQRDKEYGDTFCVCVLPSCGPEVGAEKASRVVPPTGRN